MRERIEEVGGKFNVSSHPEGGTLIIAELEVPDDTRLSCDDQMVVTEGCKRSRPLTLRSRSAVWRMMAPTF